MGKTSQQGLSKSGPTLPRWLCSQGRPGSPSVQLGALWWGFSLGIHPGSAGAQQARPLAPQLCCSWAPVWGHLRPPFPQMTLQPTLNRHTVNSPSTKGSLLLPPREGMGVLVCSQRRAALNRVSSPLLQIRFFLLNLIFRRAGKSVEVGVRSRLGTSADCCLCDAWASALCVCDLRMGVSRKTQGHGIRGLQCKAG